jgi:hypothetical protein
VCRQRRTDLRQRGVAWLDTARHRSGGVSRPGIDRRNHTAPRRSQEARKHSAKHGDVGIRRQHRGIHGIALHRVSSTALPRSG